MQTTHVGSLPFKCLNQALDYTFEWDIPVLFTLPQISSQEFMGFDLISILAIGGSQNQKTLSLRDDYLNCKKEITPLHLDAFIEYKDHKKFNKFKYQVIGPVSLFQMISNKDEIQFEGLVSFLKDKYYQLIMI